MHNVIILGSGRSGTSMIAGALTKAGYYIGDNPYPPRKTNPKGFFETREVNHVNEILLAQVSPKASAMAPRIVSPMRRFTSAGTAALPVPMAQMGS